MLKQGDKFNINGIEVSYEGSTKETKGLVCACGCGKPATSRMYQVAPTSHLVNGKKDILSFRESCFKKIREKASEETIPYELNPLQEKAVAHLMKIEVSRAIVSTINNSEKVKDMKCRFDEIWSSVFDQVKFWYQNLPTGSRLNKTNINGAVKWLKKYRQITVAYQNENLENY